MNTAAAAEISRLRAAGYSYYAIARTLNARGIATNSGHGQWHPSTVQRSESPAARAKWAAYIAARRAAER